MKIWIIIWRLNPLHIWHIKLIESSIKQNDKTIIILWSSNISDEHNPFLFEERKSFLEKIFSKKIKIEKSNDYETDEHWYKEIKEILKDFEKEDLTFYGWDLKNDSAMKVIKQFWNFKNIKFSEKNRNTINISSTKIRQYLKEKNFLEVKKWIPNEIYEEVIKPFS